ncbi:RDD family protein [Aureimonas sp. SA4125]|uniref:RDD family protein n=1 Tax=Aureimonas sp. SA4125 TaxID=2826993 RepID=UPI001CC5A845|nr:RDD family protein [Aureimonas sp. SA4125]
MSEHIGAQFEPRGDAFSADHLYEGVRRRRMAAFVADYAIVLLLSVPTAVIVFLFGIVTLGLGWMLYAILLPAIAVVYIGTTMGSAAQATLGMRMAGLKLVRLDGARVDPMLAIVHGVVFWASNAVLTPFVLLVGLFTPRKQLLQDLLLGTVVIRNR